MCRSGLKIEGVTTLSLVTDGDEALVAADRPGFQGALARLILECTEVALSVIERAINRYEPIFGSAEEFSAFMKTDTRKWTKVIRDANVKVD